MPQPARPVVSNTAEAVAQVAPRSVSAPQSLEPTKRGKSRVRRRRVATAAGEQLAQQDEAKRKAPSWLVSFIFHVALLLILALIPIQDLVKGPLTLVLGGGGTEGDSFELQGAELSIETEVPELEETASLETTEVSDILQEISIPDLVTAESNTPADISVDVIPFGIREGLSGRTGPLRDALLSKFGGSAETEEAVELGLQWLAKQQKSDGSWSLQGPYSDGGSSENKTAATAMALNAFLGAGYTHKEGKYRSNVDLGMKYLIRRQNSEGFFSHREPSRQQMYAQAIASITVIEAFGMTGDESLRSPAMKAIAFAEWSQSPKKGWRYNPREDSDLSVTGWFLMALQTARMAGLPVDNEKLSSISEFLDSVAFEDDTRYAYNDFEAPSLSMTAEGLLCRIYLGWTRTDPALLAAIKDDLLPRRPALGDPEYSVYYWYYATQVMHHVGGTLWDRWNEAMKATIPSMQEKAGKGGSGWTPRCWPTPAPGHQTGSNPCPLRG
ncbi:MAG: prenyltransferase/squalene oxidase repeat-containing protein, partial [Planctomycetota bacterium]